MRPVLLRQGEPGTPVTPQYIIALTKAGGLTSTSCCIFILLPFQRHSLPYWNKLGNQ